MLVFIYYVTYVKGMVNIRRNILRPLLALLLGIIGAVIRKYELSTVFEAATGLSKLWQPVSIILALLSVVSIAAFIVLSIGLRKKGVSEGYSEAMSSNSQALFVLALISACGIAGASVLYYFENSSKIISIPAILLSAVGFMASLTVIYLSRPKQKSAEADGNAFASAYFVIFICLWLVLEYKSRSADPVLLDYVYDFLALCSAAMAFYYKAGFAFSRPRPLQTSAYMQMALYFCIVAIPGADGKAQMIYYVSLALLLIRDMLTLEGNLIAKE